MKHTILAITFGCVMLISRPALAYLDPGSTSMIWQLALTLLAGVAVFFKFFWRKLISIFRFGRNEKDDPEHPDKP